MDLQPIDSPLELQLTLVQLVEQVDLHHLHTSVTTASSREFCLHLLSRRRHRQIDAGASQYSPSGDAKEHHLAALQKTGRRIAHLLGFATRAPTSELELVHVVVAPARGRARPSAPTEELAFILDFKTAGLSKKPFQYRLIEGPISLGGARAPRGERREEARALNCRKA